MRSSNRKFLIILLLCLFITPEIKAQLIFKLDSLSFVCLGDIDVKDYWTERYLFHRGPDMFVYGRLENSGKEPVILELEEGEYPFETDYRNFGFNISYASEKKYNFPQDPLNVTDVMSFPYLFGYGLPQHTNWVDGRKVLYSLIMPSESIPIAFETLSRPRLESDSSYTMVDSGSEEYREMVQFQHSLADSIRKTLTIYPVVDTLGEDNGLCLMLIGHELSTEKYEDSGQYDFDSSIPRALLDKKPEFPLGEEGFKQWFLDELEKRGIDLPGQGPVYLMIFVVGSEGHVVYSRAHDILSKDTAMTIENLLLNSPPWIPGEINVKKVDSRIGIVIIDSSIKLI